VLREISLRFSVRAGNSAASDEQPTDPHNRSQLFALGAISSVAAWFHPCGRIVQTSRKLTSFGRRAKAGTPWIDDRWLLRERYGGVKAGGRGAIRVATHTGSRAVGPRLTVGAGLTTQTSKVNEVSKVTPGMCRPSHY
jgi:hypothetical protein